jgi:transcriptional regulator with XRE-family HTH domain
MKMKQPELGRKIADLRKAKGYTQEELVEKCNLSVRTLQRIESGEVVPRSHTIRVIFAALDYKVYDVSNIRLRLFFKQVLDVFNLKTNTMKKLSILTVVVAAVVLGLLSICTDGIAQSDAKVKKIIEGHNADYVRWFNAGQADSILTLYTEDACMVGQGCGKEFLREAIRSQIGVFKFEEMSIISLNVGKTIAVEKGSWIVSTPDGARISGEYLTEWHRMDNKEWKIVNDISSTN